MNPPPQPRSDTLGHRQDKAVRPLVSQSQDIQAGLGELSPPPDELRRNRWLPADRGTDAEPRPMELRFLRVQ
jgi:hypothetical protein